MTEIVQMTWAFCAGFWVCQILFARRKPSFAEQLGERILSAADKHRHNLKFVGNDWISRSHSVLKREGEIDIYLTLSTDSSDAA